MSKIGRWGDVTMKMPPRIVMGAMVALPLLVHCFFSFVRLVHADGVLTVWPT